MNAGGGSAGADLVQLMDSDGDGAVSQNELTSFVTANGGTSDEAASIFNTLSGSASSSSSSSAALSASDINAAIKQANPYDAIVSFLNALSPNSASTATSTASSSVSVSA